MNDQEFRRLMRPALVLCLCGSLAACGGGSDIVSSDAAAPPPAPTVNSATSEVPVAVAPVPGPAPTSPAAPEVLAEVATPPFAAADLSLPVTLSPADEASCGLNGAAGIEAEVLQRVNALRAVGAVCGTTIYAAAAPLNWNSLLLKAASGHSADMANNNYFSHVSLDGKTMAQRISEAGYSYSAAAENIAAGDSDVQGVVGRWLNSPGHCINMMNATYRDIAVACKRSDSSSYGRYWTMNLGRP